ncbi:uncharacterized protein SPSK_01752 [Sporothrix schenckii 1099-18]|uniref:Azaphilone pigments biosynthesis cluster protein L N-terminal domain-containing protein n=1 Tax=Sporothrix schenckii 1099-18 TaxID=1397361 RepID=A0A0F2MAX5_SPOSC|nr:uncharacterized protein SPSK_01752 [Sporothrix schenckii 1099-18]KJR86853.1 hypothetical protein SPSK_01752 [Sporothrix schenckii 1099-18]
MDPLSITASALAMITAAAQATNVLCGTVSRYKERDKMLRQLYNELDDLNKILKSLGAAVDVLDTSMWTLLEGPVKRCGTMCSDFEAAMQKFSAKPTTGFRDWMKMEFMRGNINTFMDSLARYKATINIALGTITMSVRHSSSMLSRGETMLTPFRNTSQITREVLNDFHEMIKNTVYDLHVHLQRIEEEISHDRPQRTSINSSTSSEAELEDEKDVIKQCIRICEDAESHLEFLQHQDPPMRMSGGVGDVSDGDIEAQQMTFRALSESRDRIAETIGRLQERLNTTRHERPEQILEKTRLQEDIDAQKKSLELCRRASEQVSFRKVHTFGEIVSERDSGQVVVTTLADVFDVKKVLAGQSSTQLVGSMTDETLVKIAGQFRNDNRPGAPEVDVTTPSYSHLTGHPDILSPSSRATNNVERSRKTDKPVSNSVKKRTLE